MIRNIIRYVGLALVIVGIVLVMKNLFSTDTNDSWGSKDINSTKTKYYEANIKLLDEETKEYIAGSTLVLKDEKGKVVDEWKTSKIVHTVVKLENGTYKLSQVKGVDGYEVSDKVITFKIDGKGKDIVMHNKAIVKEVSKEVNVESTASSKSIFSVILAIGVILSGIYMLVLQTRKVNI